MGGIMLFVPVVHHSTSERAQQLSKRLAETVEQFRREHTDLTSEDIQQAMQLAQVKGPPAQQRLIAVAIVAAILFVGLAVALLTQPPGKTNDLPLGLMAVFAALAVFAVFTFIKSRG
jgi:hypothetical protein